MLAVSHVAGGLHPATERWARSSGAILRKLDARETAYWEALTEYWALPGILVHVEQDVLPSRGVVEEMHTCEHLWCSSPYAIHMARRVAPIWVTDDGVTSRYLLDDAPSVGEMYGTAFGVNVWLTDGLGCVKFSDELKRQLPDAIAQAGEQNGDVLPHGTWRLLDVRLSRVLRAAGLTPHLHTKSAHLHEYYNPTQPAPVPVQHVRVPRIA